MRVPTRRGDYRRPKADPYLTEEKFNKLKDKLEHLKKVTRLRLMKEVAAEAENGDFSENAAYQIAKGQLRSVNQAILDLEEQLKQAIIVKDKDNDGFVKLGSRVTVQLDNQIKVFTILGSSEVNLEKNIISHNSPLGSALLNKLVGDKFKLVLKNKVLIGVILKVE